MNCEQIKLQVQALTDNELDEKEIPRVIRHLESCYRCRNDYIELLALQKQMKVLSVPEPTKEWFEDLSKNIFRGFSSLFGKLLFFGSYILLLGYALFTFFSDSEGDLFVRILVGGIVLGFIVLLGVTIGDRVRESRTDKYKGVMK